MTETVTWSAPPCPFVIEYSPRVLDEIRIAVSDAFFSVPRGGAEIGGVLLGSWREGRVTISGYAALDCEHAFGPSFKLSERDRSKLAELTASSQGDAGPVGWYHSHTRSPILLSEADCKIHHDFFQQPWQVALVLKPDKFLPTRAGFFFREADGSIQNEASYLEFTLEPLAPPLSGSNPHAIPGISPARDVIVDAAPAAHEPPSFTPRHPAPEAASQIHEIAPRTPEPMPLLLKQPARAWPRWPKLAILLAVGAALGAAAYWKRDLWMPGTMAMTPTAPAPAAPIGLGLNTLDFDGQLQVRWDRNSLAIQKAQAGNLRVSGAGAPAQEIALDRAHLLSGVFTVARQSESVDVALTLTQPDGPPIHEATSFLGKLPSPARINEDPSAQRQRDELASRMAKVQSDLDGEIQRNRKLQKSVDFLAKQLRDQQRARLTNQAPGKN